MRRPALLLLMGFSVCAIAQETNAPPTLKPMPDADVQALKNAYAFRSRMGSDPQCQDYAQRADAIFMNPKLTLQGKIQQLSQVAQQARAANCTD